MKILLTLILVLFSAFGYGESLETDANSGAGLVKTGSQFLAQGKLAQARKVFLAAHKAHPRSENATLKLAGVDLALNDFSAAIPLYKAVIAANPNSAKAFIGLGIAYLHAGDKSMSRALFQEALRLEPGRRKDLEPLIAALSD